MLYIHTQKPILVTFHTFHTFHPSSFGRTAADSKMPFTVGGPATVLDCWYSTNLRTLL